MRDFIRDFILWLVYIYNMIIYAGGVWVVGTCLSRA